MSTAAAEDRELRRLALSVLIPAPGTVVPNWLGRYFEQGLASNCLYGGGLVLAQQLGGVRR